VINKLIFFSLFLAAISLIITNSIAADSSNCINCHTNEAAMKIMHKPPPLPESEGEG
jgi:hypothetical protein